MVRCVHFVCVYSLTKCRDKSMPNITLCVNKGTYNTTCEVCKKNYPD